MALSAAGLRQDGRRPGELRHLAVKMGHAGYDGSAYLEMGQSRVLVQVFGPHQVDRRRDISDDSALLHVEYVHAPFAGATRKKRRAGDRQSTEAATAVKQSLAAAVEMSTYPRTQIDVFITVLEDDGSLLPACINAGCLALIDAGIVMTDMIVACSGGIADDEPIVDLNLREQNALNFPIAVLPGQDQVVLALMDSKLPLDKIEPVLKAAILGCHQVHSILRLAVQNHTRSLINAKQRKVT
uniref:Uncharacterized protein n=1 Tax=Octactis speculum TaxID=3111310 RepID=A0A7S2CP52_9STRA|mmetsp:Transcript_38326/g.51923  ORF Transcript_38326/g.51923 Transcript_38326/m.51923 type:complete len:241 (+) Transcript_38326:58-780(+)|eukprot:CAMPEP_0185770100 /NCGR_PEP_ID=MMETSP1174-20130828/57508_1 /TAXON_ID=35687 /ORGANISM="Dictyocha speculum, Strain CCMP1381" /LENGTH=240 /DNA_ID=CAMNT_0028455407 /DNA_START=32 /DNA_END=754 /DNA_ORIENTATION=-